MVCKHWYWLTALALLAVSAGHSANAGDSVSQGAIRQLPCFGFDDNLPNRIDAGAEIHYAVPYDDRTALEVLDIEGQTVALLVDALQTAGSHSSHWDGKDSKGTPTASGVYFIRLKSGAYSEILKIIVIRQER